MLKRTSNFLFGYFNKPKLFFSLDYMKYLYEILCKNRVITKDNQLFLVEAFKELPELIVWGDQNLDNIFEFFSTKDMMMFFIMIIRQKCGSQLTYQIFQALNIIIENIRNEHSLNYILSNNNLNYIISHEYNLNFDEILAYYISLLKIMSMKINSNTVGLFYDHATDFPLITESIKYFDHSESMIRINVRNILLNVLRLKNIEIDMFFTSYISETYFTHLFWKLKSLTIKINIQSIELNDPVSKDIVSNINEIFELFQFMNDILEFSSIKVFEIVENYIIDDFMYKFLLPSLFVDDDIIPRIEFHVYYCILSQMISAISITKIRLKIYELLFFSPKPLKRISISALAPKAGLIDMLASKGLVKSDYDIEKRIQVFLNKLFLETRMIDNVPFGFNDYESSEKKFKHISVDTQSPFPDMTTKYSFRPINSFTFFIPQVYSPFDLRVLYFYLNFLIQIYNEISETELRLSFDNIENYFHLQLQFIIHLIRFVVERDSQLNEIIVYILFFFIHISHKKFNDFHSTITKCEFIQELDIIKNSLCEHFNKYNTDSCKNSLFKTLFLFAISQTELLKPTEHFFNNLNAFLIHPKNVSMQKLPKFLQPNAYDPVFIKILVYIQIINFLDVFYGNPEFYLLGSFLSAIKNTETVSSSIHSSDYDIAACCAIFDNEYPVFVDRNINEFVILTENHLILADPAPTPYYGNLIIKNAWLYSNISICSSSQHDILILWIQKLESLASNLCDSKLRIQLKFLTDDARTIVSNKLSIKMLEFDRLLSQDFHKIGVILPVLQRIELNDTPSLYSTPYITDIPPNTSRGSMLHSILNDFSYIDHNL